MSARVACVVCGDTVSANRIQRHCCMQQPWLAFHQIAASMLAMPAGDVEAAHAAGMSMLAVAYGYIEPGDDPWSWGAEAAVTQPDSTFSLTCESNGQRKPLPPSQSASSAAPPGSDLYYATLAGTANHARKSSACMH
ncbi:MAG: hypothetical protein U1F34_09850 [Gammaproteobacteria bacterium]